MRTELEPFIGQVVYIEGRIANFQDGTETFGPTSDPTRLEVKDVCLSGVKFSPVDPDRTGKENNDAFFDSNLRTDHLWIRVPERMAGKPELLTKRALLGLVCPYVRRDGSEDIGVELIEILKSGTAMEIATKHVRSGSLAQAYAIFTDLIETATSGAGMLIAPNASHNQILANLHYMRGKVKPVVQMSNENDRLKQEIQARKRKPSRPCKKAKSKSNKGFA